MKTNLIKGGMAAGLLAMASAVGAQSVTFNVTGTIQQGTCSFTIPDTDLGTYGAWTFTGMGYTAPWTSDIPVAASGCTADINTIHMVFNGTPDATNSQLFKAIPVSGQGNISGVAIDLSTASGTPARLVPNTGMTNWTLATVGNTYYIKARFYQTSASVTPGKMQTPITAQFTYN
ncbi:fimbrial protein [Dyella japonica]|uniref:Type 1 fimbria pilin n=1 Tax=Dyella japonica TaxID=231455 RepID=A0ABV2K1M0_9GAMM